MVDWQRHGLEPRWFEMETADCAAALQPSVDQIKGSAELERFLAGTAERTEVALVVTTLGYAEDDFRNSRFSAHGSDSVYLPGARYEIHGSQLPIGTRPKLAEDTTTADRDLGLRLLNSRPTDAPWWALKLNGLTWLPGSGGPPTTHVPEGQLRPILIDPLGAPVVGVWVSPDEQQRWYVLPDVVDWNTVLDWLVQHALPTYAPTVLRRFRAASFIDPDLQTPDEAAARQALTDMETRHAEERSRLEAELTQAQHDADPVRYGLLYGSSDVLVEAVATALTDAGFTIIDLDKELGGTRSADLLVTLGQHRRLVEVKAASGRASENFVADLHKHLGTWPQLRPKQPVSGGALVVNHQHKLPPGQRSPLVYTRPEFVNALTVSVIATRDLFDWWKASNWGGHRARSIRRTTVRRNQSINININTSSGHDPITNNTTEAPFLAHETPQQIGAISLLRRPAAQLRPAEHCQTDERYAYSAGVAECTSDLAAPPCTTDQLTALVPHQEPPRNGRRIPRRTRPTRCPGVVRHLHLDRGDVEPDTLDGSATADVSVGRLSKLQGLRVCG